MAVLFRWFSISLLVLGFTVMLISIATWIPYATAPTGPSLPKKHTEKDYSRGVLPLSVDSARFGLLGLIGAGLYWLVGLWWAPAIHSARNMWVMKVSLVLVPTCIALGYAILFVLFHPGFFRPVEGS